MLCTHSALTCPRGQLPSESEDNFAVLFQLRYYDSSASLAAGWHRRKAGQNSRCVIQAVGQGCGVTEVSPRDTFPVTDGYRNERIRRAVGPCYPLSKSHLSHFSPFFLSV